MYQEQNFEGMQEHFSRHLNVFRNGGFTSINFESCIDNKLWMHLLTGNSTTHRLKVKLVSFLLECLANSCPEVQIVDSEWGEDGPHEERDFRGDIVFLPKTCNYEIITHIHLKIQEYVVLDLEVEIFGKRSSASKNSESVLLPQAALKRQNARAEPCLKDVIEISDDDFTSVEEMDHQRSHKRAFTV